MKGIKTILGVLAAASLLVSFSANAQENGNRDENGNIVRGAYETNGAWDNWFIGVGAGVNSVYNNGDFGKYGIATDVNVGKWFTPSIGARVGWQGLTNKAKKTEVGTMPDGEFNQFDFFHGDFMWNISNALSGYKETRFWDIIPYTSFGGYWFKNDAEPHSGWEYGGGFGVLNQFYFGKHVDGFVDLTCIVSREGGYYKTDGRFISFPSAKAGLIFKLGNITNFKRHSSIVPVVVPMPFTVDQYNALKDKVAALEKENASLRDKINELENQKPDTVYVENNCKVTSPATVYFDLGKATLSARELAHLDFYAQNVLAGSDQAITVTGSADKGTGTAAVNQKISQQRADYVKNLLVKKYGVSADKITVVADGDKNNQFDTPAKNRVVIIK